jgi:hypothetical protein
MNSLLTTDLYFQLSGFSALFPEQPPTLGPPVQGLHSLSNLLEIATLGEQFEMTGKYHNPVG